MRHTIQQAGHEYMPVLFMAACIGSTLLFFLGKLYDGTPPPLVLVPVAAFLAICVEWATLTFGQDMQDTITNKRWSLFFLALPKALITYAASTFFMANASAMFWAPRDVLLGINPHSWAWIMAIFVFGVQFLMKLAPEAKKTTRQTSDNNRPKAQASQLPQASVPIPSSSLDSQVRSFRPSANGASSNTGSA